LGCYFDGENHIRGNYWCRDFFNLLFIVSEIDFAMMTTLNRCSLGRAILRTLERTLLSHFSERICLFCGRIVLITEKSSEASVLRKSVIVVGHILNKEVISVGDMQSMSSIGALLGPKEAIVSIFGRTDLGMIVLFPI
jgi:hypothetical protein